ncbi:helix-turn-helix transcriptional regulator [Celeribacter halophilus]|uniref:Helix-turn-helix domain-containing protein n=1 Tax=Celeribacter halophilus TaxID=576117 RepID=A0A1I3XCD0_9RHOB|nr:helix-turn-helix domain-containing protein [Celeribacter halophilus]PZX03777.1 helix-turn-helix protein [Celeribacter halophilus]SFK16701.1 Helix-turn-helix domain-containing protein [Celeribacter halophilus]
MKTEISSPDPQDNSVLSEWISMAELAGELGVSKDTLGRWHTQRIGPPRAKIGGRIWYRRQSVREWLREKEGSIL